MGKKDVLDSQLNPAEISLKKPRDNTLLSVLLFLHQPSELDELLLGFTQKLRLLLDFDYCAFALNQDNDYYRYIQILDQQELVESELNVENNVLGRFWKSEDDINIYNTSELEGMALLKPELALKHFMFLRLTAYGNSIGIMVLGTKRSQPYYSEDGEVGLLVSNPLALSLNRLQQMKEYRSAADVLQSEVKGRERAEETMKCIVEGTGAEIGNNFFKSVVQHMATAIGVRYAFVGKLVNNGTSINTIAVWSGAELIDNFSYSVEGSSGDACSDKICYCCDTVTKLLPGADMQRMMSVQSCWGLPLNNSSNETVGVLVVMHDGPMEQEDHIIPIMKIFAARSGPELERIHMEAELFEEKERAQVTVDSIGDGVITTDADGKVNYVNPVAEKLTGWSNSKAQDLPLKEIFYVLDEISREPILSQLDNCLKQGISTPSRDQVVLIRKDGEEFPIASTMSPIFNREQIIVGSVVVFSDVSELRRLIKEISYHASHDALTGLVNRRELEARLQELIDAAPFEDTQHALCYLDLDRFKVVNDTCGHIAGDELLKQVSSHIQSVIRTNDIAARLGGDEFAVLLSSCPLGVAQNIAEKLRKTIKDMNFYWDGQTFTIGASVGVAPITKDTGDVSKVITIADSACYIAKGRGRNAVYVHHPSDFAFGVGGETKWVREIRRGLQNDNFCLYSQKIASLSNEGLDNFEVLIRLPGIDGKIVPPMTFIPAAERYNLMPEIDRWVIGKVFSRLGSGRHSLLESLGFCSINLSGQSIGDERVLDFIVEQTEKHNITPHNICFEVTETAAISNIIHARSFMSKLAEMGFLFALDDFGSGLSSFAYLKNLPVDLIKIDGEFVKDIVMDEVNYTMVDSINRIAHVMGLKVVAEHVENNSVLAKLRDMGIDFAQGNGIAKPELFISNSTDYSETIVDKKIAK